MDAKAAATGQAARRHGIDCPKVTHLAAAGYGHAHDDDSPYDVDGVMYCGRCHAWMEIPAAETRAKAAAPPPPATLTADEVVDAAIVSDWATGGIRPAWERLTEQLNKKLAACAASPDSGRATLATGAEAASPSKIQPSSGNAGSAQLSDNGRVERLIAALRSIAFITGKDCGKPDCENQWCRVGRTAAAALAASPDTLTLERVRLQISQWRDRADERFAYTASEADVLIRCADQLEALLAAPETEKR